MSQRFYARPEEARSTVSKDGAGFRRAAAATGLVSAALIALLVAPVAPSVAGAQCVGDCNEDSVVSVDEVIVGIGIGLGGNVAACAPFDVNLDDAVEITELVSGIGNLINGCPTCGNGVVDGVEECDDGKQCQDGTTDCTGNAAVCKGIVNGQCANRSGDGCQANCKLPFCGDGIVDNVTEGETCDDGNNDEGFDDTCPANCRVAPCTATEQRLTADIDFLTDTPELLVAGMDVFVRYPDGVVSIPGSSGAPPVLERVTSDVFSITPNDVNFAVTAALFDQTFVGQPAGTAFRIEFDVCQEAGAPVAEDFTCIVGTASDPLLMDVTEQVTCTVVLP